MDESVLLIQFAEQYGFNYSAEIATVWPASQGVYRGRNIRVDEYGVGGAMGPAPFAIFTEVARPPGFELILSYYTEPSKFADGLSEVEGIPGYVNAKRGNPEHLANLVRTYPYLMAHFAENPYFFLAISPRYRPAEGVVALYPFRPFEKREPETLEHWSNLLELGTDLAEALDDSAGTRTGSPSS
jgi:hypothetical protein